MAQPENAVPAFPAPPTSAGGMQLRQRRPVILDGASDEGISSRPFVRRVVQAADLFPKPKEDYRRQQTPAGAAVSVVCFALIAGLVVWEFLGFALGWDAYRTELSVDIGVSQPVPFNIDITFPSIACHELHLDALDASGAQENNVEHDLFKIPIDAGGNPVYHGRFNYVDQRATTKGQTGYDETRDPRSPKFCGYCYIPPTKRNHGYDRPGGKLEQHLKATHGDTCCNTCDSVMKMYDSHRIPRPPAGDVEQCINELSRMNPGCNIKGSLLLQKVRGNFHFAPGIGTVGPMGQHIHSFDFGEMLRYNVSHTIHHFSVGDRRIPRFSKRGVTHPLDGLSAVMENGLGQVKYFVNIVPVVYRSGPPPADGDPVPDVSYEFAATRATQESRMMAGMQLGMVTPNVVFVLDYHPIQMHHVFQRPPLTRFLVKVCGIVGGLFVVLGGLDRVVGWLAQSGLLPSSLSSAS